MDPTEDLSGRVLLKHILSTEPPRTPITRSASQAQSTSSTTSSSKSQRKKDAGAQTPQEILRRSLRHKMRESITRKSLPATKRRTASLVQKKINTPAPSSVLFDDGDTPRHILMNILRTEPTKSPAVHEKASSEEPQPSSDDSSITRKRPSIELSGLDLPDLTIANPLSTAKGLSRKRPRRSLNVTAFEKRLKDGEDFEEENEETMDDHSSLSLSSSASLSLKTPFVDVRTEKKGLRRRVSNRRKITEEEFGAAVNKRHMGEVSTFVQAEQGHSETTFSEGFTLGLSKLSEPDITTDILHCNTALYAQPDAMTSSFSIVATQDKPTVMASQLQRQMDEVDEEEEEQQQQQMEVEEEDADAAESQNEEEKSPADGQLETAAAVSDEEEGIAESQTGVRDDAAKSEEEENRMEVDTGTGDSQTEEEQDVAVDSQTEEEEEGGVDSQPEEDTAARPQCVEDEAAEASQTKEDVAVDSQTEEEEKEVDSQHEEDAARSQSEEEENAPDSQIEEEEEEGAVDSQTEEEGAFDVQSEEDVAETGSQSEEEDNVADDQSDQADLADSQPEDEHDGMPDEEDAEMASEQLEHISRRAHRSEGGLIMPVTEAGGDLADATDAGWSDEKSKAHSSLELESGPLHTGIPDLGQTEAEPDTNKENSCPLEGTHDIQESPDQNDDSPEEAVAQDPAEQEEEWEEEEEEEEEEDDEIPSKTPAFVKQKILFLQTNQPASPSVFKNNQPSGSGEAVPHPKQKQVRQKRTGPTKKEVGLPKSYLMSVFKHFAKTKVSADVYPVLKEIMDKYFDRMAEDLETFALHAKRKTIEVEDAELLLKRQGHVNDKVPVEVLIEKYLRMDQRKLLIPIATSGNVVVPKRRR